MSAEHTTNEKAPVLATPGPLDHTINTANYPASARLGKALEIIKAQFAARGHAVHDGGNKNFIVVHRAWGHSQRCPDHFALIKFGRQLGVLA